MLEKIGLPAKPSLRGNNWVVDASHCQGCSSQFTFINRKHHCRRCGGLFCNSCTQQRMVLRGQGDSQVRICDPCKKLEEAARFEMRHGQRSRTAKGRSKLTSKHEEEVLNQILGSDRKETSLGHISTFDMVSNLQRATSSASCSNINEESIAQDGEQDMHRCVTVDMQNPAPSEMGSTSPEELRQQALEEKKKYRILKGEGKPDEALRAFKRGKDLERQALALEAALRKTRKKASSSSLADIQNVKDGLKESGQKSKRSHTMLKEEKGDLVAELKELGWSDMDLHEAGKKKEKISLESELSSLLGEIPQNSKGKGNGNIDRSQVLAHKKKALIFKREGNLAEAKEELKKAKVLEKQLEEQDFLAEAEDSDDELASLIHSMDDDKQDGFSIGYEQDPGFNFENFVDVADDLGLDGNFEVTAEDMDDPEITGALKSLGWTEESSHPENIISQSVSMDREALLNEILSLKREALNQKRAGNTVEAMEQLKKAKLLERDLEMLQSQADISASLSLKQKVQASQTIENSSISIEVDNGTVGLSKIMDSEFPKKSKLMIQKELLGLKKKALALRREGRLDEAEEELKKGKVLEHQLEEMESASKLKATRANIGRRESESTYKHPDVFTAPALGVEGDEVDVTDQDMHDPALLSMLQNLGWNNEDVDAVSLQSSPCHGVTLSEHATETAATQTPPKVVAPRKTKAEIQRELLGLKRRALALRRQGEAEEAEEVLRTAKVLEAQLADMEVPLNTLNPQMKQANTYLVQKNETTNPPSTSSAGQEDEEVVTEEDMNDPTLLSGLKSLGWRDEDVELLSKPTRPSKHLNEQDTDSSVIKLSSEVPVVSSRRSKAEIQRELLGLKRKALALRRQGENEEAEEILRTAKALEDQMKELEVPKQDLLPDSTKGPNYPVVLIAQEENGNITAVGEVSKVAAESTEGSKDKVAKLQINLGWKDSNTAKPPPGSSARHVSETSWSIRDQTPLIEVGYSDDKREVENVSFPQSRQSANLIDLLTGDDWRRSQLSIEEPQNKGNITSDMSSVPTPPGTFRSTKMEMGSKEAIISENSGKTVLIINNGLKNEVNSAPQSVSHDNKNSLQQDILAHKRKAVALKREGKLAEAREELRQAKLLEKGLNEISQSDASISTSDHTSVGQEVRRTESQAPKPMSGRDRFKLQQESLAHKRQALKLRREGRTEEAEAEFELAKALEMQLGEMSGNDTGNTGKSVNEEKMEDLSVEDFLDPQLLSALKAIGLQDADIVSRDPVKSEVAKPTTAKRENSSQERSQLEERIKEEKVKALGLKRAGKQAEALEALRTAKQLEKKLNSLPS
ncbi:PREDICTED: myosin-11 [Nelumbo nucifera]|uniref:Myosin-11 n=2 Tax=Nelumbo nucifera TaxID=4432 RepID=A0A1U7YQ62_NELNU|nr:PREDICTED: myosin-11 [Nelumbo nucifera]DAD20673.1 TPA_asm: hypothetical protein HUJ06_022136 [Nelumbo nucifera]